MQVVIPAPLDVFDLPKDLRFLERMYKSMYTVYQKLRKHYVTEGRSQGINGIIIGSS